MNSRRRTKENPGCLRNRGFSLVAPIKTEDLQPNESHPSMIGAGCPVLPLRTGAGCLFHSLSSTCVSLSSLPGSVLCLPSL
jgi:hypothetical protein